MNKNLPEHQNDNTVHIFMLVKATRCWLDLKVEERQTFFKDHVFPLLKQRPEISLRYFEPEYFNADVSDILVWKTADLQAWYWFADHLRDTKFWNHYFEVKQILPSVEANYGT